jgi:hypothetical protein
MAIQTSLGKCDISCVRTPLTLGPCGPQVDNIDTRGQMMTIKNLDGREFRLKAITPLPSFVTVRALSGRSSSLSVSQ